MDTQSGCPGERNEAEGYISEKSVVGDIRPIPGHPQYGANPDGRIWSRSKGPWRPLALSLDGNGQPKVNITSGKTFKVHTLVALTFLGPRPHKHDVDHKDGDKRNCALDNLEYCTRSRNIIRALKAGRLPPPPVWVRSKRSPKPKAPPPVPLTERRSRAAGKLGIRQIPNCPAYGVTADGNVWSYASKKAWRKLVRVPCSRGLPKVKLRRGRTVSVHTLIAEAFIGPRPKGMTISHIDGKRWNTAACNLRYVSKSADNLFVWAAGAQQSGWQTRTARLKAKGYNTWGRSGAYPAAGGGQ